MGRGTNLLGQIGYSMYKILLYGLFFDSFWFGRRIVALFYYLAKPEKDGSAPPVDKMSSWSGFVEGYLKVIHMYRLVHMHRCCYVKYPCSSFSSSVLTWLHHFRVS
jgi:hypothetical protein